jgi:predicted Zn finger-like uncharacterized protein
VVIECSSCQARFKLADDKIKENGTKVRCTKCREVFTVFPESPPPSAPPVIAVAPVKPVTPVVTAQKKVVADALFSGTDTSPFTAEAPSPAVDAPANKEDDWNQDAAAEFFPDEFPNDAGASDLDAISFDNIEAPVFSVSNGKESKFEFTDDTAFSFTDSSLENETEQPYKIAEATEEQSLPVESAADFEADSFSPAPTPPVPEDLSQFKPFATDGEFSFSGADNLADFSWNEPDATPGATTPPEPTTPPEQIRENESSPQDTAFDFSSFSFDDIDSSVESDENKSDETIAPSEATIELSLETETAPAPDENRLPPLEASSAPVTRDRQESTPRPSRPMRPRLRQKKKGSSRLAVKAIILIIVALAATYSTMNRDQIQKMYKSFVNSFIENQTRVETSGRIGLVALSGSYVHNNQEGDLFVIRGEAVNEFKGLRSSVLVRGTIYGDNGEVLQSQSAYCGNPLNDSSLMKLGFKEIRDVMSNELGENLVNLNIATSKGIPFAIIFNKVPKNIKEFTVEVLESKPGSK